MVKAAVLVAIGVAVAAIIGGIFAVLTYSEESVKAPVPEINTENSDAGKVIKLKLGEAASMGDGP